MAPRIYEAIGHLYLDKITPRQLQRFINNLGEPGASHAAAGHGLSPKSIRNYLSLISSVFTYEVKMGMVPATPCRVVTLPPLEAGKEKVCYTLDQA